VADTLSKRMCLDIIRKTIPCSPNSTSTMGTPAIFLAGLGPEILLGMTARLSLRQVEGRTRVEALVEGGPNLEDRRGAGA